MSYAALSDILAIMSEAELIRVTDDEGAGSVDEDLVAAACGRASAKIDGYVGRRHDVPLSPVPDIITAYCADLAVYDLYSRSQGGTPEDRRERHKDAIRFLERVAAGTISLGASDPDGTPAGSEAPEMSSDNPARVFSRDNMGGF